MKKEDMENPTKFKEIMITCGCGFCKVMRFYFDHWDKDSTIDIFEYEMRHNRIPSFLDRLRSAITGFKTGRRWDDHDFILDRRSAIQLRDYLDEIIPFLGISSEQIDSNSEESST